MAEQIFKNAFLSIAGHDVSAAVKSVNLTYQAGMQDKTTMGNDTKVNIGGLKEWGVTAELHQDWAAGALDSYMFALVGTVVAVILRPDAGVKGVSNPEFTGNAILDNYPPMGGSVGDLAKVSISLKCAGTLARATA